MDRTTFGFLVLALVVSAAAVILWAATGRHYYTKYEVVERVEAPVDPNDPLAGTGFYDEGAGTTKTVRRKSFHFGLLPTPQGVFDKHALSVVSTVVPVWAICLAVVWWRRRHRTQPVSPAPR